MNNLVHIYFSLFIPKLNNNDQLNIPHCSTPVQSRALRNAVPNFVWSLKRYDPAHHHLNKDSLINHFIKASSFTTKVRARARA